MLATQQLLIGYQQPLLHQPISVLLPPHQLTMLVGINGAGKSTLLRTLAGLQPPIHGQVLLAKQPMRSYTRHEIAQHISLVLTEKAIQSNMTVEEMLQLGRIPHTNWWGQLTPQDLEVLEQVLQMTQLVPFRHRTLGSLSDGQRQKVHIARALVQDTPILLLDEPTTHLDLVHRAEIFLLLKEIAKKAQKTVLVVTHEIDFALQTADYLWVIHHQQFFEGLPQQLIESGLFQTIFTNTAIYFDAPTRTFRLF